MIYSQAPRPLLQVQRGRGVPPVLGHPPQSSPWSRPPSAQALWWAPGAQGGLRAQKGQGPPLVQSIRSRLYPEEENTGVRGRPGGNRTKLMRPC